MNEEEKQAINYLKDFRDNVYAGVGSGSVMAKNLNLIFEIIDKQQKEIEDLKDKCKELIFEKQELTSALLDSIPKDKIKEKIEELKEYIYETEKKTCGRCITIGEDKAIQILRELLGE